MIVHDFFIFADTDILFVASITYDVSSFIHLHWD